MPILISKTKHQTYNSILCIFLYKMIELPKLRSCFWFFMVLGYFGGFSWTLIVKCNLCNKSQLGIMNAQISSFPLVFMFYIDFELQRFVLLIDRLGSHFLQRQ